MPAHACRFIQNDLAGVDRSQTPFIVVGGAQRLRPANALPASHVRSLRCMSASWACLRFEPVNPLRQCMTSM